MFLEIILVIAIACSQISMARHAYARQRERHDGSFLCFLNRYSVMDYIRATREENGSIGGWFWTFVLSLLLLLIVVANDIKGISELPPGPPIHQDSVWPVL
jgi:hypothetical protein